ncbi:formyl peptide receptor-related sequence 4-like [Paramisgurnus dabryanus]|uniref:formyl peptide receptor-related sequence 4-like n=1 Tax=Paramisgurnus dabryanus TaxID=90735 RepID=UPI0031F40BF8
MSFNTSVAHQSKVYHEKTTLDIVCYTIIVLLGTTGNSVVIWVAGVLLKPSINNVWLINLAVADLIFCMTHMTSLIKIFIGYWPFGDFMCKLKGFLMYANMFCSVFLLAVISVDRVICVWCPIFTRKRRTLFAARLISLGVWIVAVIFSSPNLAFWKVSLGKNNSSKCSLKEEVRDSETDSAKYFTYIRFFCGFLFPFMVIFICYTLAAIGIRRTRFSGKSRPLRILALLVFAFFLCWAPYHILRLNKLLNNKYNTSGLWHMATNLAYFNSCVNPVLYFCMGLNLRRRSGQSLLGIFHRALKEEGQILSQNTITDECSSRPLSLELEPVSPPC